jgi:hypothetical protein
LKNTDQDMTKSVETNVCSVREKMVKYAKFSLRRFNSRTVKCENIELKEQEHTDGILFSCTNAIETSAWFMINSTALGPVKA